jgi:cobalt-zinc-cadmium efflux system protein
MSTTETALTAHLVMQEMVNDNAFLAGVEKKLHENFGIDHATLQIEIMGAENPCRCRLIRH